MYNIPKLICLEVNLALIARMNSLIVFSEVIAGPDL